MLVEGDRVAAIRRREGDPDGAADLRQRTSGRTPAAARDLFPPSSLLGVSAK
jgi:hypothetical protein